MVKEYAGLTCDTVAVALQPRKPTADAVQLLELGGGVIANLHSKLEQILLTKESRIQM